MKILVVRFKQIGDAILSSVICKSLKETYPDAEVDYVLYDHVAPLFEHQDYLNKVISISKDEQKNPFKYLKKVWNVTRADYDIVIDIMSTPKSEVFTLFSRKAKYKIGRWKPKRGYTYTHSIPEPSSEFDKVEKFLKMLEPLIDDGIDVKLDKNYSLKFLHEEKNDLRKRMEEAGVDFNKIIIPLAINSRRENKVYPIDLMKELAKKC
ncbi:MAG: glycosyltransferase family 9 protein [Cetobacterium sp.]|uniref:glycosyltransferase family 9 protein n=1 Tax=Cetobacterium sp. TaxID=2071632 RepID=UPI003F349F4D